MRGRQSVRVVDELAPSAISRRQTQQLPEQLSTYDHTASGDVLGYSLDVRLIYVWRGRNRVPYACMGGCLFLHNDLIITTTITFRSCDKICVAI